jgi:hypothetical protein
MHWMRVLGIVCSVGVIACCFFPWFVWEGHGMTVSGIDARLIRWGRPAAGHFLFCGLFLLFHVRQRIALRLLAVGMAAFNFAWAVRDIYIGLGNRGETIKTQPALYGLIVFSALMLVAILVAPDETPAKVPRAGETTPTQTPVVPDEASLG